MKTPTIKMDWGMIVTAKIVVWLVSGIGQDAVFFFLNVTLVGRWAG